MKPLLLSVFIRAPSVAKLFFYSWRSSFAPFASWNSPPTERRTGALGHACRQCVVVHLQHLGQNDLEAVLLLDQPLGFAAEGAVGGGVAQHAHGLCRHRVGV